MTKIERILPVAYHDSCGSLSRRHTWFRPQKIALNLC